MKDHVAKRASSQDGSKSMTANLAQPSDLNPGQTFGADVCSVDVLPKKISQEGSEAVEIVRSEIPEDCFCTGSETWP